jgi:hypothetical protein
MREINRLAEKVHDGLVGIEQLQRILSLERHFAAPVLTMRTLDIFSAEYENRQAQAEQELTESQVAAARNIPIIEELLRELGASTDVPEYKSFTESNVDDGPTGHGR